jgi:hypothetical protein
MPLDTGAFYCLSNKGVQAAHFYDTSRLTTEVPVIALHYRRKTNLWPDGWRREDESQHIDKNGNPICSDGDQSGAKRNSATDAESSLESVFQTQRGKTQPGQTQSGTTK